MKLFDVQSVEISAPTAQVFEFIRNPANLPRWTNAFSSADNKRARMETPAGAVEVQLDTIAHESAGTIDWRMHFPDGNVAEAHSRVSPTSRGTSVYSFVLHAPPVPLEQLEGALDAQKLTLASELSKLKRLLES